MGNTKYWPIVIAGLIIGASCSEHSATTTIAAAAPPSAHQNIAATIQQGFAATEDGDRQSAEKAGATLMALKARPFIGEEDLSVVWGAADSDALPMRGRVRGPGYRVNTLGTGQSDAFGEIFYGVEEATVSVSGPGNYEIAVMDEGDRPPLCEAETVCRFTPDVTAQYRIVIRNQGAAGRYIFIAD